jgi:hypothetical protein
MKKLLTIAALLGVASLSYGQGFVSWFNGSTTRISNNTQAGYYAPGTNGAPVLQPASAIGTYIYALLVAPTTVTTIDPSTDPTLTGGWTFTGDYGTNIATAGRLAGWNNADGSGNQIPGYAVGSTADFAVVGWSSNIGTTWAQAEAWWANGNPVNTIGAAEYFGISGVGLNINLSAQGSSYTDVMGPSAVTGFHLNQYVTVPEPTTFALAGLGAAALVIFRRRKV